jgi:hypothetical protein
MAAVRTDDRFRDLTPENVVTALPVASSPSPVEEKNASPRRRRVEVDGEVWVDWSFVEFWKTNYCEHAFESITVGLTRLFRYDPAVRRGGS